MCTRSNEPKKQSPVLFLFVQVFMVHNSINNQAFVTLLTSDNYCVGALVLAHSLRESGTCRKIVCMVTDRVSSLSQNRLKDVFDQVIQVNPITTNSYHNLNELLSRPDLYLTFTKFQAWTLTNFEKIVFLDADTLVLKNVDDLFEMPELSAAPDVGWPDCFNSGVFVLTPSQQTFTQLTDYAQEHGSFDGGDQGILNDFFKSKWNRIPFVYNVTPSVSYSYAPAYKKFGDDIKIVHFIGSDKPWTWDHLSCGDVAAKGRNLQLLPLVQKWWDVYYRHLERTGNMYDGQKASGSDGVMHHSLSYSSQTDSSTTIPVIPSNPFFKSRYDWNEKELNLPVEKTTIVAPREDEVPKPIALKKTTEKSAKPAVHASSTFSSRGNTKK